MIISHRKACLSAAFDRQKVEDRTDLTMDLGNGGKQDLYRMMEKDAGTGEWVLHYHFGK